MVNLKKCGGIERADLCNIFTRHSLFKAASNLSLSLIDDGTINSLFIQLRYGLESVMNVA
jgi:hypothetical protein